MALHLNSLAARPHDWKLVIVTMYMYVCTSSSEADRYLSDGRVLCHEYKPNVHTGCISRAERITWAKNDWWTARNFPHNFQHIITCQRTSALCVCNLFDWRVST